MDDIPVIEHTLVQIRDCLAFRVPPLKSSEGYRAQGWNKVPIWEGRLKVVSSGNKGRVVLEHRDKEGIFAICNIYNEPNKPETVIPVIDSSRYFVLMLEDGTGKHAYIGLAFRTREDSFDFKVALQDFNDQIRNDKIAETIVKDNKPPVDYSIPEGKTIKINLKGKLPKAKQSNIIKASVHSNNGSILPIAPPPASGSVVEKKKKKQTSQPLSAPDDDWIDFSSAPEPNKDNFSEWVKF